MSVEQEAAEEQRKRGWCQSCVAHFLAMFGCYVPEVSMVRYLTHYHTVLCVYSWLILPPTVYCLLADPTSYLLLSTG